MHSNYLGRAGFGGAVGSVLLLAVLSGSGPRVLAQDASASGAAAPSSGETVHDGYAIHQSADLGGHIADINGSGAMYNTMVNMHTGPRVLGETFQMETVPDAKHMILDHLYAFTNGFGGDPNNVATLRFSKGKSYDFQGSFRRDRQYFDYDLFANPLVPAGLVSNGYTFPQLYSSAHLFNTVRRMTDVDLTVLPVSKFTMRFGYSQNVMQGPSYSSVHQGANALLFQNWRNSTDTFLVGADYKPVTETKLSFQETITHYKGDTNWNLAGAALQLANGTPVSLGVDNVTVPGNSSAASPCGSKAPILNGATNPPTANPCINQYTAYTRIQPTRTLFPTEEFRFQSSSIRKLDVNGRFSYTGANMSQPNMYEYFNGILTRTSTEAFTVTGNEKGQRISVAADFGMVYRVTEKVSLLEQYDFENWRQPMVIYNSEVDQAGASTLNTPGAPQAPKITSATSFLGQKTHTNTVSAEYQASSKASFSLGYRYRNRILSEVGADLVPDSINIHENTGIVNVDLRPSKDWRVNGSVEAGYADDAYVQLAPRQTQRYNLRTSYRPKDWATVSVAFNDLERRNNVYLVNHLDHNRSVAFNTHLAPTERYGLDLNYGYIDVYTQQKICYTASVAGTPVPTGTACGTNNYLGNFFYDAPTHYGSIALVLSPVKAVRTNFGYRVNAVNGNTLFLNPRQVPGALQSQFHSPFANVAWTVHPGWIWKGDWNYYGYGEDGLIGPTSPRTFHANVVTLAMHYEF